MTLRPSLLELVQDAPLYRRGATDPALARRPVVVYCHEAEIASALQTFESRFQRLPAALSLHDAATLGGDHAGVPLVPGAELAARQELLPWVYGKGERGKGIVLARHGVRDFVFADDPPYRDTRYQPDLLQKRRDELERLDAMLADHESRLTLASIVKQRLRGEHGFLRIARYAEYSHPRCQATAGDVVIDAGAYDGRTSLSFALQAPGGRVHAFEPDPSNRQRIRATLDAAAASDRPVRAAAAGIVEIAPYALFDREQRLRFSAARKGSSSLLDRQEGGIEVEALPLDLYVERRNLARVDLVSIDVEGAEAAVLEGMRGCLERDRPKLQVSMYHHKNDLFELAFLIERLYPDCLYFLGHHNTYSTETDLYVVPREKLG